MKLCQAWPPISTVISRKPDAKESFSRNPVPLGILTGYADRLAALIMAGYCAVTAVLFKRFWEPGDFWKAGKSQGPAPLKLKILLSALAGKNSTTRP